MAWHSKYLGDTAREMSTHLKAHANLLASEYGIEMIAAEECLDLLLEVPGSRRSADSLPAFGDTPLCLLADLLRSFPANDVVDLIKSEDLIALVRRIYICEYLAGDDMPFFTLVDLATHAEKFARFLVEHREFIVRTGLPPRYFRDCRWLHVHLGRLYDTRQTSSPLCRDEIDWTGNGLELPPYQWKKSRHVYPLAGPGRDARPRLELESCENFEDANYLSRLKQADAERLERDRPILFDLKLDLVRMLAKAAASPGQPQELWRACIDKLATRLTKNDMEFYLKMDHVYLGGGAQLGVRDCWSPKWSPGGLTNLLHVVGRYEVEIVIGTFTKVCSAVDGLLREELTKEKNADHNHAWYYFKVLKSSRREQFDAALDEFASCIVHELDCWTSIRDRLQEALEQRFHVPVNVELLSKNIALIGPLVQDFASKTESRHERGELIVPCDIEQYIFRKDGTNRTICFKAKPFPRQDSVGLEHIATLLANPGKPFSAMDLQGLRTRREVELPGVDSVEDKAVSLPANDLGDAIEELSEDDLKRSRDSLTKQIEDAERAGNMSRAEEAREELDWVKKSLRDCKTPKGKTRKLSPARKRAQDAVKIAIKRELLKLAQANPELGQHLTASIRMSKTFCYAPEMEVPWVFC